MNFELLTTKNQLEELVYKLQEETVIAVDTETTGLDPYTSKVRLLQIGTYQKIYIIDCFCFDSLDLLKPIFEQSKPVKIFHNAKFDIKMLKVNYGLTFNNIFDTMLASQIVSAGEPKKHSLKEVALRYLGVEIEKTEQKSDWSGKLNNKQLEYASKDVEVLLPLRETLKDKLVESKMVRVAILEFNCCIAVADMEINGCYLDKEKWLSIAEHLEKKHHILALEIQKELSKNSNQLSIFDDFFEININSSHQLLEALGNMGIHLEDTSEATLMHNKNQHPVIAKILEYRGMQKAISSYGKNILAYINTKTNRIHADFHQLGAGTGRFSCTNPNLQQIPATQEYRSCFCAEKGYKLITADYSQIELRILAEISQDPEFIKAFNSGEDLHKMTASNMFGVAPENVTKEMRSQAKSINFGLVYGRGANSLAEQIGSTKEQAQALINKYFEVYRGVQVWLKEAASHALKTGQSRTLSNRQKKYAFDPHNRAEVGSVERQGKNSPIQGTSADITKQALIFINQELKDKDIRLINTIHDEIVLEAIESKAEYASKLLEEKMIKAAKIFIKTTPIVVDVNISDFWSK